MATEIKVVPTKAFTDQKPGTSGLRKKTKVVTEGYYLHNFIQSIFDSLPAEELKGCTLLVSGDGRYYNKEAITVIANIAFANGVSRIWVGRDGLMSTPAASAVVREREGGKAYGAIILTASHNPGGPENDFGVKYNTANGGPAQESLTNLMFEKSKVIKQFKTCSIPQIDISKVGTQKFGEYVVEVIDPVEDWMCLMKKIFDFSLMRSFVQRKDFKVCFDGLNGVAGPYAKAVLCDALGARPDCLRQCVPKEDFGGIHPDPNLTYAAELVDIMKVLTPMKATSETPDFGAAGDGDNDRNMILGKGFFVTPSDSVAVIAAYAQKCIPYFAKGVKGLSRSLPTSCAIDLVGKKMGLTVYEVPTGWKFFGNLMDAGKLSICGEESFGTGSDHIREKDGLWAVLAWLSILAFRNKDTAEGKLITVEQVMMEFWQEYGRNYYSRFDYEEVESGPAQKVMDRLTSLMCNVATVKDDPQLSAQVKAKLASLPIKCADNFTYTDPVDGSVSKNQGIRFVFEDGSRVIWRLSGTGSVGATVRVYFEKYESARDKLDKPTQDMLKDLMQIAAELSQLEKLTGRKKPTVIT